MRDPWREKEDEAKKRQLCRDKQMLLASRTMGSKEQDSNNIYDPFNPTLSDSSSSDVEAESTSLDARPQHTTHEGKALVQRKQGLARVKTETQVTEISDDEPSSSSAQETISQEVKCSEKCVKVEKESRLGDTETKKQTELKSTKVKKESELDDAGDAERFDDTPDATLPVHHLVKTERETLEEESDGGPSSAPSNCKNNSSSSSSVSAKKTVKTETKSDSKSCSKSPSRDLGHKKKVFQTSKERRSSSPDTDRGRKGDHHASGQGGRHKEKKVDRERSSRRSRSRERRRRARSTSESSKSNSPDRNRRKRRRSRSRSKDRRRSR